MRLAHRVFVRQDARTVMGSDGTGFVPSRYLLRLPFSPDAARAMLARRMGYTTAIFFGNLCKHVLTPVSVTM